MLNQKQVVIDIDLLHRIQFLLNVMPNRKVEHPEFKDSYELASQIDAAVKTAQVFPNTFTAWHETYNEVVSYMECVLREDEDTREVWNVQRNEGSAGLYTLALSWTNEFETIHEGREWDGEFFDEIWAFCEVKDGILENNKA